MLPFSVCMRRSVLRLLEHSARRFLVKPHNEVYGLTHIIGRFIDVVGVLVQYQGITVEDDTKMRAALRKAGVEYAVIKNSITGRACDMAGYPEMKQYLEGMTAFAVSAEDPIAPAKILKEFSHHVSNYTKSQERVFEGEL